MTAPALSDIKAANAAVNDRGYALVSFSRPFGPYLAWLAIRMGTTPRQVNYFSLLLVFAILGLVAAGGSTGRICGTALVFLWQIIDVTDGTMARALKIRDNFGGFVDYATGMVIASFLPFCLAIGVYGVPDGSFTLALAEVGRTVADPSVLVLMAGAGVSMLSLYMRLINRVLLIRFGDSLAGSRSSKQPAAGAVSRLHTIVKNLETIGGVQAMVFCAAAVAGLLEIVLVVYFFFYVALLGVFALSTHRGYGNRTKYLTD
ncbi:MAG: hypothetical protein DHS20C21_08970 [Gemmatimonadota bacterium]|nr:MAG: hypothetical protein DHS20C21_08970 [Gemmatimonadota bacterium]